MDGHYINLDRSPERRTAMEAQLQALGMPWVRRLAAIDGAALVPSAQCGISAGELACFASHAQAIAAPSAGGLRLVLEDDVQIAQDLPTIVEGFGAAHMAAYHLIFLDCQPYVNTTTLTTLWQCLQTHRVDATSGRVSGVNLYDADDIYHFGATAYLVTPAGRAVLSGLLQHALDNGPTLPIDMWFNKMCHERQIRAAVVAPFLVTPTLASYADSTLVGRAAAPEESVGMNALRRMFFAGPWEPIEDYAHDWVRTRHSDDPQLHLLTTLFMKLTARGFVAQIGANAKPAATRNETGEHGSSG